MVTVTNRQRNIIWLASYPKSGNTWVRFLLLNLLHGNQESSRQLDRLIPDLHNPNFSIPPPGKSQAYAKIHLKMTTELPYLERTAGFIYIVGNPIDVLLSNLNYVYLTYRTPDIPEICDDVKNDYVAQFIRHRGDPRWLEQGMGSWDEHVVTWSVNPFQFPGLIIRYEDLLTDTAFELCRVCDFLDLQKSTTEISDAVNSSTFNRMRAIEDKEIENKVSGFFFEQHRQQRTDTGARFMSYGKSREGDSQLSHEQRNGILELFYPTMTRLGYSLDKDGRIVTEGGSPKMQ